jgi:hypothetical protein
MHRRPPSTSARPLLASREHHSRCGEEQLARCLFLLDPREIRLIGAYLQGDLLDGQKAQRLCDAHQWAIHVQQSIKSATEGTRTTHQSGQSAPGVHAPPGLTWAIRLGLGHPLVLCRMIRKPHPDHIPNEEGLPVVQGLLGLGDAADFLAAGTAISRRCDGGGAPSHAVPPVPWWGEATRHCAGPELIRLRSSLRPQVSSRDANRCGEPVGFGGTLQHHRRG